MPKQDGFVGRSCQCGGWSIIEVGSCCQRSPCWVSTHDAILVTVKRGGPTRLCSTIIPRESLVAILVCINAGRDTVQIVSDIFNLCTVDQFLTFQHTTEQEANDDQHDGNFD